MELQMEWLGQLGSHSHDLIWCLLPEPWGGVYLAGTAEKSKAQKVNSQSHLDSTLQKLGLTQCDVSKTQICPDYSAKILQQRMMAGSSQKPETLARHSGPSLIYLTMTSL